MKKGTCLARSLLLLMNVIYSLDGVVFDVFDGVSFSCGGWLIGGCSFEFLHDRENEGCGDETDYNEDSPNSGN